MLDDLFFHFVENMHSPGKKRLMRPGYTYTKKKSNIAKLTKLLVNAVLEVNTVLVSGLFFDGVINLNSKRLK